MTLKIYSRTELRLSSYDEFLQKLHQKAKIIQGLLVPQKYWNHYETDSIVGIFHPVGRTLEAYLDHNGFEKRTDNWARIGVIGATVMADIIRAFLTLKKIGFLAGSIHPSKIYLSVNFMNALLYPEFGLPDGSVITQQKNWFPYYTKKKPSYATIGNELTALGFLYLQLRV